MFNLIAGATNQPYVAEFGDTGRGVFRATIKPATGGSNSAIGIWVDDLVAGLSNVADTYTNAPGVSPLDPFGDFHAPAVNSTCGVAFRGCLSAGCTNDGIWAGPVGAVSLVALTNLVAPDPVGSDPGETFVDFSNPVLNEAGAIAFRASKTGMHTEGIWRRATQFGTGLRRIVQRGDMLRGTNLEFVAFGEDIAISDTAELAFTAMMSDDPNSTLDDELGLFTTFQLGANPTIVKIVKVGEAFDFTTSQTKMVKNILFHPGAYPMGNTGFIHVASSPSQSQAIGFALTFDDQSTSRALVLSTVE